MNKLLFTVLIFQSFYVHAQKPKNQVDNIQKDKKFLINIPINFGERIQPGTKPILHDSGLNSISFTSHTVAIKQGNQGGFDTSSLWGIELTGHTEQGIQLSPEHVTNKLIIKSSKNNGFVKSYNILDSHYDEDLRMQEFDLGDNSGKKTHTLDVCWFNIDKKYFVDISSIDNSEDYQFNIDSENTNTITNSLFSLTKVSNIQAKLFYNENKFEGEIEKKDVLGTFSGNIIDNPEFSLWNTAIGEGSAKGYSNQTIVIVEIISKGMSIKNQILKFTATTEKKILLQQQKIFNCIEDKTKYDLLFLLDNTYCEKITIKAELLKGTKIVSTLSKIIDFQCGE